MSRTLIGLMAAVALALSHPGAADAADGWVIQPMPLPPGVMYGSPLSVACPSATACVAVGFTNKTRDADRQALTEVWDGSNWTVRRAAGPPGTIASYLDAVSCTSAASCTAVGDYSTGGSGVTLAEHWDGSAWAVQPTPNPAGSPGSLLDAISCASASSCTAVGQPGVSSPPTLAEHWNGRTWAIQPMPTPPNGPSFLTGISCTLPASCLAVGFTANGVLAESWNGRTWKVLPAVSPGRQFSYFTAVSCPSAGTCVAAGGESKSVTSNVQPFAESWHGGTWTVRATPLPTGAAGGYLAGISCTSASRCTAVGSFQRSTVTPQGLAEVWDGSAWAVQGTATPVSHKILESVSCAAARTCTAVGDSTIHGGSGHTTSPLAEHE